MTGVSSSAAPVVGQACSRMEKELGVERGREGDRD